MKIGTTRMWKLLLREEDYVMCGGKPLSIEYEDDGAEFHYDGKVYRPPYCVIETEADCKRLCNMVNDYFNG